MVSRTDYAAEECEEVERNSGNDKWIERSEMKKKGRNRSETGERSEREDDGKSFNSQSALAYR